MLWFVLLLTDNFTQFGFDRSMFEPTSVTQSVERAHAYKNLRHIVRQWREGVDVNESAHCASTEGMQVEQAPHDDAERYV